MKTPHWTPKWRSRALGLIEGGRHSLSEITTITNIPKGTLKQLKKRNTPLNKVRSGRPPKLSPRHKCQIVFHITRNHESRRLSVMSIIQDLQLDTSITWLKCTLKDLGYNHRIARRWPFLNKLNRKRHLRFAKRHAHFTVEDWKAFIWTDELSVKVGMQRSSRDWIWRRDDEEFHPDCIDYKKRATGTGMMFWGEFRWGRMGPGVFFWVGGWKEGELHHLSRPNPERTTSGVLGRVIRGLGTASGYGRQCSSSQEGLHSCQTRAGNEVPSAPSKLFWSQSNWEHLGAYKAYNFEGICSYYISEGYEAGGC